MEVPAHDFGSPAHGGFVHATKVPRRACGGGGGLCAQVRVIGVMARLVRSTSCGRAMLIYTRMSDIRTIRVGVIRDSIGVRDGMAHSFLC